MNYDSTDEEHEDMWNLLATGAQDRITNGNQYSSDWGTAWAANRIKTLEAEVREKDAKIAELRTTAEAGKVLAAEVSKLQREIGGFY